MSDRDDIEETLDYLLSERVIAPESAAKIRAAVAEHDALRDAVRGYLATLPEGERSPFCGAEPGCPNAPARTAQRTPLRGGIGGGAYYVCEEHAGGTPLPPLPPRVVALRALAALVRS